MDEEGIRRAAATLTRSVDHLDVLVNNAGILEKDDKSVLTVSAGIALRTFATNTLGPLLVAQAFLPLLLKSPAPRIINVSSGGGSLTEMEHWAPAYSISKAALNAVTRQFASAMANKKVAVNSVCPGWIRTAMGGNSAPRSVEEGADTIVWLAAEAPQELTGKSLRDRQVIDW
jgi:NAD(P)-dependent dehydrogenase (short-subunit alcohol dehydrogenase family)